MDGVFSLKNASIEVIRDFAPSLSLGPRYEKTRKGTVVHVFPPGESLEQQAQTCPAGAVVFPRYVAGAQTRLIRQAPMIGMQRLISNSFNYLATGEAGFAALCDLVRSAGCYELAYSRLDEAVNRLAGLLEGHGVVDAVDDEAAEERQLNNPSDAAHSRTVPA